MPIGDAKPFQTGTGNPISSIATPLINNAGRVVSALYTARKKGQQRAQEAPQPEYVSTKETAAHGDSIREQIASRQSGAQANRNLSSAQHGSVTTQQASPAGARKEFNQRRVMVAQTAASNQRRPLTPAQQKAAGMTRRSQG